jgi:PAS domain S-box-containing protein
MSVPANETDTSSPRPDPRVGYDQLLALIDNTSAVIYMRDLAGRYMLINREYERLFHVAREEIIGLTDHDLFPPEIAADFRANDLQALERKAPMQIEETAPGEDGPHTYITVKFPLIDHAGEPYAICGISTDITDRKRAEEQVRVLNDELEERVYTRTAQLEASTRELDAFAYSVSHDLRAPLRSLHGISQILMEDYADSLNEEARAYLVRLQVNATHMGQLIDDLLRLSRATRTELTRIPVNLGSIATSVIDELQGDDPSRQVQFETADALQASADPRLLRLVLQNLLGNAWKFTANAHPARISLGSCLHKGQQTFVVQDNGAGFDPQFAARMFEPFQRLHSAEDFGGSGIGLAIASRVVDRHGGTIWAESTPGNGATFFFTLPSISRSER